MDGTTIVASAVSTLTTALKTDPEFYEGYKANIAMAFCDEFIKQSRGKPLSDINMHQLANDAADKFLKSWCSTHT